MSTQFSGSLWVAALDTRNFSFEGYGETRDAAWGVLVQGLRRHGVQYKLADDWFADSLGDIEPREVKIGAAYRDGSPIVCDCGPTCQDHGAQGGCRYADHA